MDIVENLKKLAIKKKSVAKPSKDYKLVEKGVCSLFMIGVEKGRKAYRYDVDIMNLARNKSLTRGADDGQRALNRNLCYELLTTAYMQTAGFGMDAGAEVVYDQKSTMFTSMPINLVNNIIDVGNHEVNEYVTEYCGNGNFTVSIVPNNSVHVLHLDDYAQYTSKQSVYSEDRSVRTFLEMAITQFAVNNNVYTPVGPGKLFETSTDNVISVDNGIVLRSGVAKGVRVVKNEGTATPALVIDYKVCPFFAPQNLVLTVHAIMRQRGPRGPGPEDWNRCAKILQDLRVEVNYAKHRSFGFGKFSDKPLGQIMITYEERKISVPEFYRIRYGITLQYPNYPGVAANTPVMKGRPMVLYPIEQLSVMEDQRVPIEKMSKDLSNKLLKHNTILPHERLDKIMQHAHELAIFNPDNPVLAAFGITVLRESNEIIIGVRRAPQIRFADNTILEPSATQADWRRTGASARYILSNEIKNWIVLCDAENRDLVQRFIDQFLATARRKGMRFTRPPVITVFNGRWMETFEHAVHQEIEFVMLIDSKEMDSHGLLKYFEARFHILTQHVTIERVNDVINNGKMQTLENILNKTNVKNYGLNYTPIIEKIAEKYALETNRVLVIGYDVAHPAPCTAQERRLLKAKGLTVDSMDPSVVGICANMAKDPHSFVGDYFYQESRREAVDPSQLSERMTWILETLEDSRPEAAKPKYVFVLRDGISEGQFAMAVESELNAFKHGCATYDPSYMPLFIFVIGTKRHFKKFFAIRDGKIENLAPGSVVSTKIVREDCPEFFMQSHYPLKGVGKAVEYSVPVDEIGISQDRLQAFLNALCYSHQIVNMAVSLPEPIYQADELAKRGAENFKCMKIHDRDSIPRDASRIVNPRALTMMLSYMNSRLATTRFSA